MQYELKIFEYEDRSEFRTMEIDGEPWFVGIDVCNALAIRNPSDAYSRLDAEDLGTAEGLDKRGVKQPLRVVNESGLFALIFESRRPEAKRFKRWVTSEVLPAIRRTGTYGVAAQAAPADWQPFLDRVTLSWDVVPEGYFSIFKELADVMATLIRSGLEVNQTFIPDISVGSLWGRYWAEAGFESEYGARISYPHSYPNYFPQSRSNPQSAWAYPEDAIPVFKRWVRNTYFKSGLPNYLSSQVKQGKLGPAFSEAALIALGAVPAPKPILRLPPRR